MINTLSASDTTSATAAALMKKATGMNKDDFLKLFMTQLQNQDPLAPQDSSQFIGQLAQLTQVEQAYNTNSNLQNLLNAQNNANSLAAVSFVGKDILAYGSQISMANGSQPILNYRLSQPASQTTIDITNAVGTKVRTLAQGQTATGDYSYIWDGKDNNGISLPAGKYNFAVNGTDASGNPFSGTPLLQGKVDGVKLDGSAPVLTIGGIDVPLSSLLTVKGAV
jgi:flagellar basal-body rod modification protein FlgD